MIEMARTPARAMPRRGGRHQRWAVRTSMRPRGAQQAARRDRLSSASA